MKSMLIAILAARVLCAQVPDRVLRLIGPEARWVYGGNVAEYRRSVWQQAAAWYLEDPNADDVRQMFTIATADRAVPPTVIAIRSAAEPALPRQDAPLSETALKVKHLAESYDVWFLMLRPLEQAGFAEAATASRHRKELMEVVQEVSGGMRLGPHTELRLEVIADTPENASTLAGLARWMPGLISLEEHRPFAPLVDLVEGLSIRAEGTRVTLSCYIAESRLRDALAEWRKRRGIE